MDVAEIHAITTTAISMPLATEVKRTTLAHVRQVSSLIIAVEDRMVVEEIRVINTIVIVTLRVM